VGPGHGLAADGQGSCSVIAGANTDRGRSAIGKRDPLAGREKGRAPVERWRRHAGAHHVERAGGTRG
jgi:hypothetical protein